MENWPKTLDPERCDWCRGHRQHTQALHDATLRPHDARAAWRHEQREEAQRRAEQALAQVA